MSNQVDNRGRTVTKRPRKKGNNRHVQLYHRLMKTPAFRDLSATAQALYLHIKFKFNGYNNGEINLSHREAAELLNLSKNTVGRYFDELQDKGFIVRRRKGYLGVEGKGKSSSWELTEEPLNGRPALRTYLNWKPTKKQN